MEVANEDQSKHIKSITKLDNTDVEITEHARLKSNSESYQIQKLTQLLTSTNNGVFERIQCGCYPPDEEDKRLSPAY